MKQTMIIAWLISLPFITTTLFGQSWIPDNIKESTILVNEFKYRDPYNTLDDVDEEYEDDKDGFLGKTNNNLRPYNDKLKNMFGAYRGKYVLVAPGKIKADYSDKSKYRYELRREPFLGIKKVYNEKTKEVEDKSYFAYRYYFFDRVAREKYSSYFFSGDQWSQIKRVIFWLNEAD